MKYLRVKIGIVLLGILGVVAACEESFLETKDPNSLTSANFPTQVSDLDLMLNGLYASQRAFGLYGHDVFPKAIYCLDHTQDQAWIGTQFWNDINQNNTEPGNNFINEVWQDCWRGVQRTNSLLEALETFKQGNITATQQKQLQDIEGQAYFMRAWFYYYLANLWNESMIVGGQGGDKLGMPLLTTVAESISSTQVPRSTVRQTWDFIVADLKKSETLLAGKTWSDVDRYKADIWAVKGLLGKVYAYTEDWKNAETSLGEVITSSGKKLVPFETFNEMFNGDNEYNAESISEINQNVDSNVWGAWGDRSAGSSIGMVIAPSFLNDKGGVDGAGWSNVFPHDKTLERYGYTEPKVKLVSNPKFDASKPVSIDNLKQIPDPAFIQRALKIRKEKLVDPRLFTGTQQPYVDSMVASGRLRPIVPYKDVPPEFYAWSFRKYVNRKGTEADVSMNNGSNFYFLRLADVYLLYAEALIKNGKAAMGLEYINKVKRRAYGADPNAANAKYDYASLSAPTMAKDPVLGNNPLRYERWAELYGEGHWWFDVRRWQLGPQEAAYYQNVRGGPIQWDPGDYAQPIPQGEIEANAEIKQNTGY